jgi:phage shock protein C
MNTRILTRSSKDRMIGGVAGGLGDYLGIDPVLVRVGFVVATLMSGVGALAYIALLAVVPRDTDAPTGAAHPASA